MARFLVDCVRPLSRPNTYWRNPAIDTDVWTATEKGGTVTLYEGGPPNPRTAEHEDKLPAVLQNWSQVKWS